MVTNFGADIRDSEAYILLFTQVAPQFADRYALRKQPCVMYVSGCFSHTRLSTHSNALNEPDLNKRAELMLQMAAKANCRKFVQPVDVVAVRH